MGRLLFTVATILALGLIPMGPASPARADTAGTMFAVGGGTLTDQTHFAFSAHCNVQVVADTQCPSAAEPAPTGYAVLNDIGGGGVKIAGPVTCLVVAGTQAFFLFKIKASSDTMTYPTTEYELIYADDGDATMESQNELDRLSYLGPFQGSQISCDPTLVESGILLQLLEQGKQLTSGNIVVQDPVTDLVPCPSLTDTTTYQIDPSCNLYTNTGTSTDPVWTLGR